MLATKVPTRPSRPSSTRRHGIRFTGNVVDPQVSTYLFGLAKESQLGEMFVATSRPLPRGARVSLEYSDRTGAFVTAQGVVTWRRVWLGERGMQVQLTEASDGYRARRAASLSAC